MYRPNYSIYENHELALQLIYDFPLGLLISNSMEKIESNYLPFLVVEENQELFLISHLAKANTHWQRLDGEVLISFQGPHRYISPNIYSSKLNVPTWSYGAVQIRGTAQVVSDGDRIRDILNKSVEFFEKRNKTDWSYQLPAQMQDRLELAIIGLKIKVTAIEAKFKYNQNRNSADYNAVLEFLKNGDQKDKEMYDWMLKAP